MSLYVDRDGVLVAREVDIFYRLAASGRKPNIVRFVDPETDKMLREARKRVRFVKVMDPKAGLEFTAPLTDMTSIGSLPDGKLWVVSFQRELQG